jgi:hypothetical protein
LWIPKGFMNHRLGTTAPFEGFKIHQHLSFTHCQNSMEHIRLGRQACRIL